jgi:putative ABC transport system permease protein
MIVRDFRRDRAVTAVLVLLMTLSVVLASASAGTLVRLVGAASSLMSRADAPHVAQLHLGSFDAERLDAWVASRSDVAAHQSMLMLGIDGASLFFDGVAQTDSIQQNSLVVPNSRRDLLLDLDDRPITEVPPGTIVLPVIYHVEEGLEVGGTVTVSAPDGFVKEFTIGGFARDSIMNPAVTSSKRLAVAQADLDEIRTHVGEVEHLIEFWLHEPATQTAPFEKDYYDSGMPAAGQMVDSAAFRMFTIIGDGIAAGVVILVALLLLVVAMLSLRFSFLTAAEEDSREIGVLKAVGAPDRGIKRIYLAKYALLAGIAAALGLPIGLALTPVLTSNITRYMGTTSSLWNWMAPVVAAAAILAILVVFVVVLLHRFNSISAVSALRAGTAGRRSWTGLRLHRSRMPVHFRLGLMDVTGRMPTYLLLFLVFAISAFIVIVPVNAAVTASAPGFINYMGTGQVDLRIDLRHADPTSTADFDRIVDQLRADPDVRELVPTVTTRNDTVDKDGNQSSIYVENGDHTRLPLTYADGRAPVDESEIAMSLMALSEAGRAVGDVQPVQVGSETRDLTIVGGYQDVTNGGKTAKSVLPTGEDEVVRYVVGVALTPGVDPQTKAAALAADVAPAKVSDIEQWRGQTLGPITDLLTRTATVSAVVALVLAALMTSLFVRMLLARDAGQIAVQRAVGADDPGLRRQYVTRILLVLLIGVVVGTVASNTVGETLFNLMFEGMFGGFASIGQGTSRIAFAVQPMLTYLVLPAALLATVALTTVASSRSISHVRISALTTE